MPTKYLDFNTVYMTEKQWNFSQKFCMENPIPVSCAAKPALKTIRFRNLPKTYPNDAIVSCVGIDGNKALFEFTMRYSTPYPPVHTCYGFRGSLVIEMDRLVCPEMTIFPIDKYGKDITWAIRKAQPGKNAKKQFVQICMSYIFVNYLCKVDKNCFDVKEKEVQFDRKTIESKKGTKRTENNRISTVYLSRTYSIKTDYDFSNRNPIIYKCRLWEVRGHERHYADGRIVHISPYLKGVDRMKCDARERPLGKLYKVNGAIDGLERIQQNGQKIKNQ